MKALGTFLVILSMVALVFGILALSQATLGVGVVAAACLLAVWARIVQADYQHNELVARLKSRNESVSYPPRSDPAPYRPATLERSHEDVTPIDVGDSTLSDDERSPLEKLAIEYARRLLSKPDDPATVGDVQSFTTPRLDTLYTVTVRIGGTTAYVRIRRRADGALAVEN